MVDLIEKKRNGGEMTEEELAYIVTGVTSGEIPDYQTSAFLMAVYFQGMTDAELSTLTIQMAHSGNMSDLSPLGEKTVDKHSTGGVGDKTTLVVAPIVAACGGTVAKMSGRGLGFTGGTVDKLESIPHFRTELTAEEFLAVAKAHGICVVGQSGNLAPADKKLYALRDVTATVESVPMIAASVMSKKLAAGAKSIVLDVKVGSGAFMKDIEKATSLAEKMIAIGCHAGRNVAAVLTDMDTPLGFAVGNSLEVMEAVRVLEGGGPDDLLEVCLTLASAMLHLSLGLTIGVAREKCLSAISTGAAKKKLMEMVTAQGGDASFIENTDKFERAAYAIPVTAPEGGYIAHMDADKIGMASSVLGAGREKKGDTVDFAAGILLARKTGDAVKAGDVLGTLYTNRQDKTEEAKEIFLSAFRFSETAPEKKPLIYEIMEGNAPRDMREKAIS